MAGGVRLGLGGGEDKAVGIAGAGGGGEVKTLRICSEIRCHKHGNYYHDAAKVGIFL